MIIDVYAHYISAGVSDMIAQGKYARHYRYPAQNADPEVRLELMDKYGVDIQAVSQTTPVLMGFNPGEQAEICRVSNDDNFRLCRAYPDRFVNIGMVSLLDIPSALNELARCTSELDCRGVTVSSNQEGIGLDSPEFYPFYEKLVEHDLPLLIHPVHWDSYPLIDMDEGWRMMHIFGWPFDSTQAVWRLIMGGVIDRFPDLKVIIHHMGALLPYFEERIYSTFERHLKDKLPRHISEYWGNFYGDTAVDGTVSAYPCGYAFFGADRLLYGSDYPFGVEAGEAYIRDNLAGIQTLALPAGEMEKILGGNAKKLLKIQ
ncbi:MAG: amidohydrolase [Dehalococcoidales bacterium]|nr:amidohydrolase [Dehalococcoidales bacterium]